MNSHSNLTLVATIILAGTQPFIASPDAHGATYLEMIAQADHKKSALNESALNESVKGKPVLSLSKFIEQVKNQNEAYVAAEKLTRAATDSTAELDLMFRPRLFSNLAVSSDAKPSPFFPYDHIEANTFEAGIQNQFQFGLSAKLSYGVASYNYVGMPIAQSKYFEASPKIELSLPLMRNAFGREARATHLAGKSEATAKASAQSAQKRQILLDAEAIYWRLSLAREAEAISKASLERAQAIYDWTHRRVRLSLSDKAEGIQSTAQLKARKLDYRVAQDETRAASLAFNSARGIAAESVSDNLPLLSSKLISSWKPPEKIQNRPDIDFAIEQAKATQAGAEVTKERTKSNLELFGQYAFNSPQKSEFGDAFDGSWSTSKPTSTIGIRLNIPFDQSTAKAVQKAWEAEASAQQDIINRKLFEQQRDWTDAVSRFEFAKEKIKLYEDLEIAQKEKLDYEKLRQKQGRSTVAQVILFEGEYDQTAFSRIRALAELLNLNAQLKLYSPMDN